MICGFLKKDRAGVWQCGGYNGRCQVPEDPRIECEIKKKTKEEE